MTDRMQEIGDRLEAAACVYPATIDGHAALFNAIGERDEHAADDLVFLWERCAALEALAVGLGVILDCIAHQSEPCQPDGVTMRSALRVCESTHGYAVAALSTPLLAELRAKAGVGE